MSGQTNKRLCGVVARGEVPVVKGMRLSTEDAKEVGWLTSETLSATLGKQIALVFLKRGYQTTGLRLRASLKDVSTAAAAEVEVVALPFV